MPPLGLAAAVALLAGVLAAQCLPTLPPVSVAVALGALGAAGWAAPTRFRPAGAALLGLADDIEIGGIGPAGRGTGRRQKGEGCQAHNG